MNPNPQALAFRGLYLLHDHVPQFGNLLEMGPSRCEAQFKGNVSLAVGAWTKLRFSTTRPQCSPLVPAQATARTDQSYGNSYCFQLKLDQKLLEGLRPEERRLFEFRSQPRKHLSTPAEGFFSNPTSGTCISGIIRNISAGGAAAVLPAGSDEALEATNRLHVSFRLDDGPPFAFLANVRRRELTRAGILYGLQFDLNATPRGSEESARLTSFMQR